MTNLLEKGSERMRELWRMNCAQVANFDEIITAKDSEVDRLKARVSELEASLGCAPAGPATPAVRPPMLEAGASDGSALLLPYATRTMGSTPVRRGKAPPVNEFRGEDPECLLEDWLPSLEWASLWNGWSEEEQMIQLAGHLNGRALQEWDLIPAAQCVTFAQATESLRQRLDPASKTMAAQDFRHVSQRESEIVSNFILHLERAFHAAYSRNSMSVETRDALLHGQLQDRLRVQLMRGPAVSGARSYHELCIAAKN